MKKPTKSQTLIKIYQDETTVTRTLCSFLGADEETRCKVFSREWTNYPLSLIETDARLTQGYIMQLQNGCKSDFVKALSPQVKQSNLLPESIFLQRI